MQCAKIGSNPDVVKWAAAALAETDDTTPPQSIVVTERRCFQPGCPPLQTVVTFSRRKSVTIPKPLVKISEKDVVLALAMPPTTRTAFCSCVADTFAPAVPGKKNKKRGKYWVL